jgi:ATP-binding cassette subfamily B (MDR/TAP) protein 1
MSKGQIMEQGTHEILLAQNNIYASLVRTQSLAVQVSDSPELPMSMPKDDIVEVETIADPKPSDLTLVLSTQNNREKERDQYDYEGYTNLGITAVVYRLVRENPEIGWTYVVAALGVLGAGQYISDHICLRVY